MLRLTLLLLAAATVVRAAATAPAVFPLPQEMQLADRGFVLDEKVRILLPPNASAGDVLLAREITAELTDRHMIAVQTERTARLPASGRFIVMGAHPNPLVRQLLAQRRLTVDAKQPGPEGYALQVDADLALVAGSDDVGAFYGMQSLRQLIRKAGKTTEFRGATIRDWPHTPFRGLRVYLPGRDNIPYFKRFIRDFMALYKFNQLILEMNAAMRLDRHPELNAGWLEFAQDLFNTRRDRPLGPKGEGTDSTHHDTADGGVLEQDEVADLVAWARKYHVDVIPELPSLTHSYYLLTRHRDIAEMRDAEWPDAYCPSNPKSYELLFDVYAEYIAVMKPKMIHIGHDEWRITVGACPKCRDHDLRELFAQDVRKIHGWLKARNIEVMMWGDHLIEELRGKNGVYEMTASTGLKYHRPGGLTAEQVLRGIPKDLLIANWFWQDGLTAQGEVNDLKLHEWGFRQIIGNFEPHIQNWGRRSARTLGGAASAWAASTDANFGKDLMYQFLGVANLVWSRHLLDPKEVTGITQALMPQVRQRMAGRLPYSLSGDPQAMLPLPAPATGAAAGPKLQVGAVGFQPAPAGAALRIARGEKSPAIPVGQDVSSLIFLHASENRARNTMSYRLIHNFDDTADLIGHYEVRYEDGFVTTIPIRYGVNVLEQAWTPEARPAAYCYRADPVVVEPGKTFFAFEWANPRLGKAIQSVSFQASSGFKAAQGQELKDHALLIKALTVVQPRPAGRGLKVNLED